jgi:hypothetical protein
MPNGKLQRIRVRILVKAYPQPSNKYEETVCVAAISEDGMEMLRLYPIRYRHLQEEKKFDRFDLVELDLEPTKGDPRPESRHVDEASIRIISRGTKVTARDKAKLWQPFVVPTLKELHEQQKSTRRSFGIIKPDDGSLKFFVEREEEASEEDRAINTAAFHMFSLFEASLPQLEKPEFAFGYRFTSGGHSHRHHIHDWEVQAAYLNFRRRYGDEASYRLKEMYQSVIPSKNPHFIMGTMKARPQSFIVIGILRPGEELELIERQPGLF